MTAENARRAQINMASTSTTVARLVGCREHHQRRKRHQLGFISRISAISFNTKRCKEKSAKTTSSSPLENGAPQTKQLRRGGMTNRGSGLVLEAQVHQHQDKDSRRNRSKPPHANPSISSEKNRQLVAR